MTTPLDAPPLCFGRTPFAMCSTRCESEVSFTRCSDAVNHPLGFGQSMCNERAGSFSGEFQQRFVHWRGFISKLDSRRNAVEGFGSGCAFSDAVKGVVTLARDALTSAAVPRVGAIAEGGPAPWPMSWSTRSAVRRHQSRTGGSRPVTASSVVPRWRGSTPISSAAPRRSGHAPSLQRSWLRRRSSSERRVAGNGSECRLESNDAGRRLPLRSI